MIPRTNMVNRQGETWRPPSFRASKSGLGAFIALLRRWADLQTASIWADLSILLPTATGTVVDVGCGAQPFRSLFPASARYIGIDTVDAKTKFGYEIPDTLYFEGAVWPVENSSIDFILCTEVFEHVSDSHGFLDEAFRCLAPGGRIVMTVPFSARWHYIPYDYWRFTPQSLKELFSGAGFTDISIYARGNEITVACYKVNALILPLILPQGKTFLKSLALRLLGLLLSPLFFALVAVAHLSLRGYGGDDCLGYTVMAHKSLEK